jgi:hypothetical protein
MISTAIFIALEYIIGFALAIGIFYLLPERADSSMMTEIFHAFLFAFTSMLIGVWVVGFFHFRLKRILSRFPMAMLLSLAGLLLFLALSLFADKFLPFDIGFIFFFLPLTGAVTGFNLAATEKNKAYQKP